MVKPSSNYNPESYGSSFELMPEGVHEVRIVNCYEKYNDNNQTVWVIETEPVEEQYKSRYTMNKWLPVDGCVNALYDAGGQDPSSVTDREFSPEDFVGSVVKAEIIHKAGKRGGTFANIKRLYPAFSMGKTSTQEANKDDVPW